MKQWAIWMAAVAMVGVGACGTDAGTDSGTGYTQLGDVTLDGTLGSDDASTAGDTVGLTDATDSGSTDATGPETVGTDVSTDTGPAKYPDCLSLIGCVAQGCSPANWAAGCDATCLTGASPAVASAYATVATCIQNTCRDGLCQGSSDPKCIGDCIGQKCISKIAVCGAGGKTGTAKCGGFLTCEQACGTSSDPLSCITGCYSNLSATAQSQYAALDACISAAGGSDAFGSCPEQVLTCLADGTSGAKTCIEALSCAGTCGTGTDAQKAACMTGCWSQTTAAGQTGFAAALKCMGTNKAGCVDAMLTCTDPTGSATCTGTLTCAQGCQQTDPQAKSTCYYGCLHSASKAEAKKVLDLQVCMDGCKCNGDKTCENTCVTTGPCKAVLATCQAP